MYGISTYVYHKNQPSAGKYTIHGSYKYGICCMYGTSTYVFHKFYTKLGTAATNQSIIGFQPSPLNHATRIKPSRLPPETRVQHQVIHHWCPLLLKNLHIPRGESPKNPIFFTTVQRRQYPKVVTNGATSSGSFQT